MTSVAAPNVTKHIPVTVLIADCNYCAWLIKIVHLKNCCSLTVSHLTVHDPAGSGGCPTNNTVVASPCFLFFKVSDNLMAHNNWLFLGFVLGNHLSLPVCLSGCLEVMHGRQTERN